MMVGDQTPAAGVEVRSEVLGPRRSGGAAIGLQVVSLQRVPPRELLHAVLKEVAGYAAAKGAAPL